MTKTNKIYCISIFILILFQYAFSEEKYIDQTLGYDYITINSNSLTYHNITGLRAGLYTYPEKIKLSLQSTFFNFLYGFDNEGNKKSLILKNEDIIVMYYLDEGWDIKNPFFIGINENSHIFILSCSEIQASSEFKENSKVYSTYFLNQCKLEYPWVENDSDYGIGEYLEFTLAGKSLTSERVFTAKGFFIFNGFISWNNQSLYEKNSRVKKLKLLDLVTKESWEFFLEDIPNPQYIDCSGHEGHKIRVVIDEVYEGTKYTDTCISGLILVK